MKKINKEIMTDYLNSKFSNIDEAKVWLSDWANNNHQVIQDGEYKGTTFTVNMMIKHISIAVGEDVDNAFKSKHYWTLRDYYEENVSV